MLKDHFILQYHAYHPQPNSPRRINLWNQLQCNPQNRTGGYGTQRHQIQTHILPSWHNVLNIKAIQPPPGYVTTQYHLHSQHQQHVVSDGGPSPGEQYLSVIPVQGSQQESR